MIAQYPSSSSLRSTENIFRVCSSFVPQGTMITSSSQTGVWCPSVLSIFPWKIVDISEGPSKLLEIFITRHFLAYHNEVAFLMLVSSVRSRNRGLSRISKLGGGYLLIVQQIFDRVVLPCLAFSLNFR